MIGHVLLLSCLGVCASTICEENLPDKESENKEYELVWSDEFNDHSLPNTAYWGYDEGYLRNQELQDYKKADQKYARVENGKLIIEAHKDLHDGVNSWTGEPYRFEYSSAELRSLKDVKIHYGRLDVCAKIPLGRGIWPAIWMMPVENKYGGWPNSGEIDIMEYVWGDHIHNQVFATVHTADTDVHGNRIASGTATSSTLDTEFHLYSLVWEEDYLQVLFDNQVIFTYKRAGTSFVRWPFDRPFYLILNIAVGGAWGGIWGIDETIFPARMEIDYVRYYQKKKRMGH